MRCFKKSFELNPCEDVGILLSDVYFSLDLLKEHKEHLTTATKTLRKSAGLWAWVRLGMLHLQTGETNKAVNCLQYATRTPKPDP